VFGIAGARRYAYGMSDLDTPSHERRVPEDVPGPFDLKKVSWGYQPIFKAAIRELFADGELGPEREEATRTFFDMLSRSKPGSFDHVLREFIAGLNRRTKWILDLPGMFDDLCELGRELSEDRFAYGIAFFRLWGRGELGTEPRHVRDMIRHVRNLREVDHELAHAFLTGYGRLCERLNSPQIDRFVRHVLDVHRSSRKAAREFASLKLKTANDYLRELTQEARLDEMSGRLERLARAITARAVRFDNWGGLDSDYLIERGSRVVCLADTIFLPAVVHGFDGRRRNEALYLLATLTCSACIAGGSFPTLHGWEGGAATLAEWCGGDSALAGAVALVEMARALRWLRERLPGTRRLIEFGIESEFTHRPAVAAMDHITLGCLRGAADPLSRRIAGAAAESEGLEHSRRLAGQFAEEFRAAGGWLPRALSFFPDFFYHAELSAPPIDSMVADLGSAEDRPAADGAMAAEEQDEGEQAGGVEAAYVYPEWNQSENDYYENWCLLRERRPAPAEGFRPPSQGEQEWAAERARRMFERLKPDLARKEKHLSFGDEINIDLLVDFMADRRRMGDAKVRFYEKTYVRKRDLACALLLDVSGSTANPAGAESGASIALGKGPRRIIDIEKSAAMILGAGLDSLGDSFAVYGFSGNGREHCEFFRYKDLDEPYDEDARRRLAAAHPVAATRIGVALRHVRRKMEAHPARRKVVIVITDGKPQDTDYDPATRYAQYDVRMACEECERADIHVVCISTLENSRADLEIMFPHRRFVILEDMSRLTDVLPRLYLKMTT